MLVVPSCIVKKQKQIKAYWQSAQTVPHPSESIIAMNVAATVVRIQQQTVKQTLSDIRAHESHNYTLSTKKKGKASEREKKKNENCKE